MILQALTTELQLGKLDQFLARLIDLSITAGKHILTAVLVYVVGRFLVNLINRLVRSMLERRHIDVGVQSFLRSMVNILLTVLLIISVIGALGVNTTSFAALLASAGVAVGMALSGNLQNFAGGIVILLFKPYRVGDTIEVQGLTGVVREVQIFHTILNTFDNKLIYIPNGSLSTSVVVNYSREGARRVQWTIGVDYGTDISRVRQLLLTLFPRATPASCRSPKAASPLWASMPWPTAASTLWCAYGWKLKPTGTSTTTSISKSTSSSTARA